MLLGMKPKFFFPTFYLQKKQKTHSLLFLNIAQFLSALNDNLYKLAFVFFAISLYGKEHTEKIFSVVGTVFVIPFLLFSSLTGIVADRFSKKKVLVIAKALEVVIMFLAIVAFLSKSTLIGYGLLFLLAAQATLFSPAKYGIIPEIVPRDQVAKANGLLTSCTYIGIIAGTFFASLLTDLSHGNFAFIGGVCLILAVIGFLASLGIKQTAPAGGKKKPRIFFLKEIFDTLKEASKSPPLLPVILSAAYFLFIAAYAQLNVIPFAIRHLGLNAAEGGYLFLAPAIGIAIGAFFGGRSSHERIELGLSFVSLLAVALLFLGIGLIPPTLIGTVILLVFLGLFAGFFIVPLETYIQVFSPPQSRGHVIASNNFLSFCGVLLASGFLFLSSIVLTFTPAQGFFILGILSIILFGILFTPFASYLPSFIAHHILLPLFPIDVEGSSLFEKKGRRLFVLQNGSPLKVLLLCTVLKELRLIFPKSQQVWRSKAVEMLFPCEEIETKELSYLDEKHPLFAPSTHTPCLYLPYPFSVKLEKSGGLMSKIKRERIEIVYTKVEWERREWGDYFCRPFKGKILFSLKEEEL